MAVNSSDTGANLAKRGATTRFKPGFDPRRNTKGRPKSFDHFRELAQSIASREKALEILMRWADSPEPQLQRAFVEYAFGKVPDKLETSALEDKPILILHIGTPKQSNGQN